MTLVQNRHQRSNGSKWSGKAGNLFFLVIVLFVVFASYGWGLKPIGKKEPEVHKIALILPFYLDSLNLYNMETPVFPKAQMAISFYEGALMALDSLEKLGLNIDLHVYDSKNNANAVRQLLTRPELATMDLIIGPIFKENVRIVAEFARQNEITMLSPLSTLTEFEINNPYFTMLTPSLKTHCNNLMEYMFDNYKNSNFLMINTHVMTKEERMYSDCIKRSFGIIDSISALTSQLKIFNGSPSNINAINMMLDTGLNIIFVPSLSESYVYFTFSNLKKINEAENIVVFGLPSWLKFESLDLSYFKEFQVNLSSSFWVDFDSTEIVHFRKAYFSTYHNEPSKFVYKGFDTFFLVGNLCLNYGSKMASMANEYTYLGLCSSYTFKPIYKNGHVNRYENKDVNILKFEEYDLIKVNE